MGTDSERDSSPNSPERPLVVISGPSGVGKSTILKRLAEDIDFVFSVSATTRTPRPGEIDGVDYHFVTDDQFKTMISAGEFVEWAQYSGHLYGTPFASIDAARTAKAVAILDIELDGAKQVRGKFPDALLIWINPPGFEELERRLRERDDTDAEAIERRLERARQDIDIAPALFDDILVNDDVERVSRRIHILITSHFRSLPWD